MRCSRHRSAAEAAIAREPEGAPGREGEARSAMSVVTMINTRDAVHVFTDGGLLDPAGVVRGLYPKPYIFPHLNAVLVFRGTEHGHISDAALEIGATRSSFDDLAERAGDAFRRAIGLHVGLDADGNMPPGYGYELLFCGWSDLRSRLEIYGVSTLGLREVFHGVRAEPYELARFDNAVISPNHPDLRALMAQYPTGTIEELGIAVLEAQRQIPAQVPGRAPYSFVAGFVQHTVVRKDGISTHIIKTWPDRIGVPVQYLRERNAIPCL